jgi:hypothetical protein
VRSAVFTTATRDAQPEGEVDSGIRIPRTGVPIYALRRNNAPLFANRCMGFLVTRWFPEKRVSEHLICTALKEAFPPELEPAVARSLGSFERL